MSGTTSEKVEEVCYVANIRLTNSDKVGFTRRVFAQSLYPDKVVVKADRVWDSLIINGARSHEDNPTLVRNIWNIIDKRFIYSGVARKETRTTFDWSKIAKKLCKDYKLINITVFSNHPKTQNDIVTSFQIKTDTNNFETHSRIVHSIVAKIHEKCPNLTYIFEACERYIKDNKCPAI